MEKLFWVYVITSLEKSYTYVGLTDNLERRLAEHNKGYNKTTKPYTPFHLIHQETFSSRDEARKKEKYYKSGIGRAFIKSIQL